METSLPDVVIQQIVASVTHSGTRPLSELEGERLLNAIARARSNVPTGVPSRTDL